MNDNRTRETAQMFTVRLWVELVSAEQQEIRGLVRHVLSGECRYFRDWSALLAFLEARLPHYFEPKENDHA